MVYPIHTPSAAQTVEMPRSSEIKVLDAARPVDTLSKAPVETPPFTPSKPRIASPEFRIIKSADRLYQEGCRKLDLHAKELEFERIKIDELCDDNILKMKEAAERTQEAGVWSYLQRIGAGILSAISIFLGISLSAAAPFIGGALIAGGIITLANLVMADSGFWDWVAEKIAADNEENKKWWRNVLPFAVGLLGSGLQFAGLGAFQIFGTLDLVPQAFLITQTVTNIATTVTTVGSQISQARISWSQAKVTELQGKIALSQHEVDHITDKIEDAFARQQQAQRSAKHIVNLAIEARRQALLV